MTPQKFDNHQDRTLRPVSKDSPCIHCGKPDWCYRIGKLDVCNRDAKPAPGWEETTKSDKDGHLYLAPIRQKKSIRPAQKRSWDYPTRDGLPLVRVRREDYGDERKEKKICQDHWNGQTWVAGLKGHVDRADISVYRYDEVQKAIANGELVFITEGEPCADVLRSLGLVATTNIGGAKKWRDSDTTDLAGAKVILCPDQDLPGLEHMESIAQDFPDAQWLYAFPNSLSWRNLPKSQGLDLLDWIEEHKLTKEDILTSVESKREISSTQQIDTPPQKEKKEKQNLKFSEACERVKEIQNLLDAGEQEWEMQNFAKSQNRSVNQLMKAYEKALANQPPFELTDALELLDKSPEQFDWLIASLLVMATTVLLYAQGGTGKTLLVYSIIKAVTCGFSWNGFPTKRGKVLLLQTDEPSIVTAQNLKIAGFQESLPPGQLLITYKWQFSQMQQLREAITTHQPVLVVIDSLTSSNRTATVEEKDVEYGRCLYELRDIAVDCGCAVIILHHENKMGGIRGSTAIKANVSEVWHLRRHNQLEQTQRLLEVEKSRSGCFGLFQLELDVNDYSWQHQGDFEPSQDNDKDGNSPQSSIPLKAQLLNFIREHPGIPYTVEELASEFGGGNREAVRKTLERLWRSGLVQCKKQDKPAGKGTTRCNAYLIAESVQCLESLYNKDLGAGQPVESALDKSTLSSAQREVVQRSESLPDEDLDALDKTDSGTNSNFESREQQAVGADGVKFSQEDLQEIAVSLELCKSREDLESLYDIWEKPFLKAASKLLSLENRAQIEQWFRENDGLLVQTELNLQA